MTIATKERDLYTTVWASIDDYAKYSPGEVYLPIFLDMIGEARGSVLDAGCGSGKGAVALDKAGFAVTMCDVTADGLVPEAQDIPFTFRVLWHELPRGHRFAYCCDVLEHIPTQFTMLVVQRLLESADRVFLSVCNVPDTSGVWIGKSLHQTVQPFSWWKSNFAEIATVVEARDLFDNSVFLLERK
jgi:hypothetical protein